MNTRTTIIVLSMFIVATIILSTIGEEPIIQNGRKIKQLDTIEEVKTEKLKRITIKRFGTIPNDLNNPGCIRPGNDKIDALAIGYVLTKNGKFLVFNTPQDGFFGLFTWIELNESLTLKQAITKFAPHFENDTERYIKDLCVVLGCKSNTKLKDINTGLLAYEISRIEGYNKF